MLSWLKRLLLPKRKRSGPTYEFVKGGRAIRCLICGLVSYHPEDVRCLFCGKCNYFHKA